MDWVDRGVRHTAGTFTDPAADGNDDIYTGLQTIDGMELQHKGDAVVADEPVLADEFPGHDPVTIMTTAAAGGYWHAYGS
jgi:hypothetical protein